MQAHVAKLSGPMADAIVQLPTYQNGTANASAQGEIGHALLAGAVPPLPKSAAVGVVVQQGGIGNGAGKATGRGGMHADGGSIFNGTLVRADDARQRQPHAQQLVPVQMIFIQKYLDQLSQAGSILRRIGKGQNDLLIGHCLLAQIYRYQAQIPSGQLRAQGKPGIGQGRDQPGPPPAGGISGG